MRLADHYSTLGVPRTATTEEIEAAWRRAVKLWHPDRNNSVEASAMLKAINTARRVLMDPYARRRYDREQGFYVTSSNTAPMRSPAAGRQAARGTGKRKKKAQRKPGFATRSSHEPGRSTGQEPLSNEWWARFADVARRNAEAMKDEAARIAAERDRENVKSILERRPRLTRYVLMPAGIAATLLASILTVMLV